MSVRLNIDLDDETEAGFAFLLSECNALARANGEEPWTPSQLAANLLRQLIEDDMAAEDRPFVQH